MANLGRKHQVFAKISVFSFEKLTIFYDRQILVVFNKKNQTFLGWVVAVFEKDHLRLKGAILRQNAKRFIGTKQFLIVVL